jgi:HEAT repeat protein
MADVNLLISKLANASKKDAKCAAITELGNLGDEKAIKILVKHLNQEKDNQIKSFAADALITINSKKATQPLTRLLRSNSWITRLKAVETLGELEDKKATLALIRLLRNDPESNVREWAAISLGKIGDKKAVNPLIKSLTNDPHFEVRMEAANALGKIKDKKAKDALVKAFYSDSEYQVSWASASALANLNDGESKKLLKELTKELIKVIESEEDETVLSAAAKTLGEIGNEIAAKIMLRTMKISKELVRLEINLALGKIAKRLNYKDREDFIENIKQKN